MVNINTVIWKILNVSRGSKVGYKLLYQLQSCKNYVNIDQNLKRTWISENSFLVEWWVYSELLCRILLVFFCYVIWVIKKLNHITKGYIQYHQNQYIKNRASLVVQWLRIRLPMQETWVRALVQEDPTCLRAAKPVRHNYWACALEATSHNYQASVPQLLKPLRLEPMLRNEKPAHRNEE